MSMSSNVDTTFIHKRRAQIFAQLNHELGPIEAGEWLSKNVPDNERDEFIKYLPKELKKYEPETFTD
tara:strand:- start:1301 stop:1501 length:201 start_codon:yes stop_codon:yes gene_type:complete